jgi:RNA polymerase sigma-70 factor (ECF subfamily)
MMRTGQPPAQLSPSPLDHQVGEAELVRRAQRHPSDFTPLYLAYRDRVLTYCAYRLRDPAEAEDAASAIFVKAFHALPAFRDRESSFRSWLFRIAHNEVVDRQKHGTRHSSAPLDAAHELIDPAPSPEEAAITADALARLRGLLATLPPRERSVLELRLTDLSSREIATVLGISEQNVWTAQSRALHRMRTAMTGGSGVRTDG